MERFTGVGSYLYFGKHFDTSAKLDKTWGSPK